MTYEQTLKRLAEYKLRADADKRLGLEYAQHLFETTLALAAQTFGKSEPQNMADIRKRAGDQV